MMNHAFFFWTTFFLLGNVSCQAFVASPCPRRRLQVPVRYPESSVVLSASSNKNKNNNKPQKARDLLDASQRSDESGYSVWGTLSRQGPIPAFVRVVQPDKYNAAVDKFMLQDKCSRQEAMANMDYYFNDPIGWAVNRKRYEAGGIKPNYYENATQSPISLALTTVWGTVSTWFIWRIIQYQFLGVDYRDNFWGF